MNGAESLLRTLLGSAMYSLQALWTMARERLDVVTVIFANRRYRILEVEMKRTGAGPIGPHGDRMIDIGSPTLDWVSLSHGLGVEAARATTVAEFAALLTRALATTGPRLIEAQLQVRPQSANSPCADSAFGSSPRKAPYRLSQSSSFPR